MRTITTHLTDQQLLALTKIELAPGGAVLDDYHVLAEIGITPTLALWLARNDYLCMQLRPTDTDSKMHVMITDKARRELMLRFV